MATEAAIWSNMYELFSESNDSSSSSSGLPAGWTVCCRAAAAQPEHADPGEEMEHCDVWVTGSIYIGGARGVGVLPQPGAYGVPVCERPV